MYLIITYIYWFNCVLLNNNNNATIYKKKLDGPKMLCILYTYVLDIYMCVCMYVCFCEISLYRSYYRYLDFYNT